MSQKGKPAAPAACFAAPGSHRSTSTVEGSEVHEFAHTLCVEGQIRPSFPTIRDTLTSISSLLLLSLVYKSIPSPTVSPIVPLASSLHCVRKSPDPDPVGVVHSQFIRAKESWD